MLRDKRSSVRDLQERESFEIYDLIRHITRQMCAIDAQTFTQEAGYKNTNERIARRLDCKMAWKQPHQRLGPTARRLGYHVPRHAIYIGCGRA
jgi:hypothetical protein